MRQKRVFMMSDLRIKSVVTINLNRSVLTAFIQVVPDARRSNTQPFGRAFERLNYLPTLLFANFAAALALTGVFTFAGVGVSFAAAQALTFIVTFAFVLRGGATAFTFAIIHTLAGVGVGFAATLALTGILTFTGVFVACVFFGVGILPRLIGLNLH